MQVCHVAAMSQNRVIGRDGGLPWHAPTDLKRFKALTMGKMLLMGRKTFDEVGKALPGRLNIVVSSSLKVGDLSSSVTLCKSIDEGWEYARRVSGSWQNELCVVGGGEIYRQTMSKVDRIYLTLIKMDCEGDTYYPSIPAQEFSLVSDEVLVGSEGNVTGEPPMSLLTYERRAPFSNI